MTLSTISTTITQHNVMMDSQSRYRLPQFFVYFLLLILLIVMGVIFAQFFERMPTEDTTLGIDNIFYAFKG